MARKQVIISIIAILLISSSGYSAPSTYLNSTSGSFDGTNSPNIYVGGNCPPVDVSMNITGICDGLGSVAGDCTWLPEIDNTYGIFKRITASKSCQVCAYFSCPTCSVSIDLPSNEPGSSCSSSSSCSWTWWACGLPGGGYGSSTSCSASSTDPINQGVAAGGSCSTTTQYIPCTKNPQAVFNGTVWNYMGLVNNQTTVEIPIGANSNPTYSYVPGNLQLGNNMISMSSIGLNRFNYTINWTEETVIGGTDNDNDGYYTSQCTLGNDCDDTDPNVNPSKLEVMGNNKDDDCDGYTDAIFIESMTNVSNYCQYFPNSHTYYCTEKLNWGPSGNAKIEDTDEAPFLNYPPSTVFVQNSTTGTFTGANPLIISADGNCNPINAKVNITGICEGSSYKSNVCGSGVPTTTGKYGLFNKNAISVSCSYKNHDCGSCSITGRLADGTTCTASGQGYGRSDACCYLGKSCVWATASCSKATTNNNEGTGVSVSGGGSCSVHTYYTPCSLNPTVSVNSMFFSHFGLVDNQSSIILPLANFKTGGNTLSLSAGESGKFEYDITWTEVTSPLGACITSRRTKAYHITNGNIYQSGESARIINGTFQMKFDSSATETTINLGPVSARIKQFNANNLKIELYNSTQWNTLAENIQPKKWYKFSITVDEAQNATEIHVTSAEYPSISKTYKIPETSGPIGWISIESNGAWIDNLNITKKNITGGIISKYSDDFESYEYGETVLYSNEESYAEIYVLNNLNIDTYDGYNTKHIVFRAKNVFESRNIYSKGRFIGDPDGDGLLYGAPGKIEINSKNIKTEELNADASNEGIIEDSNAGCSGGEITLKGYNISVPLISSKSGTKLSNHDKLGEISRVCGNPGSIVIEGNKTVINYILSHPPSASYSTGNGGSVSIRSDEMNITEIKVSGGSSRDGGNGGSATVNGKKINILKIDGNGGSASGNPYNVGGNAGAGGVVRVIGKDYVNITKIETNGGEGYSSKPGGIITVSAGNIKNLEVSANGGRGFVGYVVSYNGNRYDKGEPASSGGDIRIYLDSASGSITASNKGGDAKCMNTGGYGDCMRSTAGTGGSFAMFNDTVLSGSISFDNSGGNSADCRSNERPECMVSSGYSGILINAKRTQSGFVGLNTTILDTVFNTYMLKLKNTWTNDMVLQESGAEYKYIGNLSIDSKIKHALLGMESPHFNISLGKEYQIYINASLCDPFEEVGCSHASDRTYNIPFVEY